MLLSLVGVRREDKARHRGVSLTVATETLPARSKVFRKLRRGADLEDVRPDYQDLLTELKLWVWLSNGSDRAIPTLPSRVKDALNAPGNITRFGGLSLGESSYLVNSITARVAPQRKRMIFLCPRRSGFHNLPTWVDHSDSTKTVRRRFDIEELDVTDGVSDCQVLIGE
jgi:CRISPR-associated protein Cas5t